MTLFICFFNNAFFQKDSAWPKVCINVHSTEMQHM